MDTKEMKKSIADNVFGYDVLFMEMHNYLIMYFKRFLNDMNNSKILDNFEFTINLDIEDIMSPGSYTNINSNSSIFFIAYDKLYSWLHGKYGIEFEEIFENPRSSKIKTIRIKVSRSILEKVVSEDYVDTDSLFDNMSMDIINATLKTLREVYNTIPEKASMKEFGFCLTLEALICKSGHRRVILALIRKNDREFMVGTLEVLNTWIQKNSLHSNVQELIDGLQKDSVHTTLMKTIYVSVDGKNPFNMEEMYVNRKLTPVRGTRNLSLVSELRKISSENEKKRKLTSKKWTILHNILNHLPDILKEYAKYGDYQCQISFEELIKKSELDPKDYVEDIKLKTFLINSIHNWCKVSGIRFKYSNEYVSESDPKFIFNWN